MDVVRNPGFAVWLTGLSGAGKSTLADALTRALTERGLPVEVLDGDEVRRELSADLGFSKADRDAQVRRLGFVAKLLVRNGVAVIVAAISPYAGARDEARRAIGNMIEVHVDCSIDELVRRDPKGLYRRALAGEIEHFTGVSDPYEPPLDPDVRVDTAALSEPEALACILHAIEKRGLLPARASASSSAR
jgi:adenylyl-sulfate kinase